MQSSRALSLLLFVVPSISLITACGGGSGGAMGTGGSTTGTGGSANGTGGSTTGTGGSTTGTGGSANGTGGSTTGTGGSANGTGGSANGSGGVLGTGGGTAGSTASGGRGTGGVGGAAGRGAAGAGGTGGVGGAGGAGGRGGTGGATGGSVCLYNGVTYVVGSGFPSSDGCNTCTCTTSGIACTARACNPDGGTDAPSSCVLDATYTFGQTGGHVAYEDAVTLSPPAAYQHRRRATGGTTADITCAPALPACNSAALLDVADVLLDIADADVQRALAVATPPLYGSDPRPVDGSVFSFLRADGRGFLAGGACGGVGGGTGCIEVPAGVARLVADLRALDQQQLKDASCAQLR